MAEAASYTRTWGTNQMKQRDQNVAALDDNIVTQPRPRVLGHAHPQRARWAIGALLLTAFAVTASVVYPHAFLAVIGH